MAAAAASSLLPPLSSRHNPKTPISQRWPSSPCWVTLPSPIRAVSASVYARQTVAAPNDLVDAIISKVKGTDGGVLLTREGHAEVGDLAEVLSKYCVEEPVKNPLIFGDVLLEPLPHLEVVTGVQLIASSSRLMKWCKLWKLQIL